jgi:hypothetical protein
VELPAVVQPTTDGDKPQDNTTPNNGWCASVPWDKIRSPRESTFPLGTISQPLSTVL